MCTFRDLHAQIFAEFPEKMCTFKDQIFAEFPPKKCTFGDIYVQIFAEIPQKMWYEKYYIKRLMMYVFPKFCIVEELMIKS